MPIKIKIPRTVRGVLHFPQHPVSQGGLSQRSSRPQHVLPPLGEGWVGMVAADIIFSRSLLPQRVQASGSREPGVVRNSLTVPQCLHRYS